MSERVLKLHDVVKRYKSGDSSIFALNNVNLEVFKGEFIMVVGPSGSGKTTLLNTIAGLSKTTEGHVYINGLTLQKLSDNQKAELRRHNFGFIFQFYNLHEGLTAQENIELPMMIANKVPRNQRRRHSQELLDLVGLTNRANNQPFELSGGERQRIGIARALANDPPIILADEPTGDLDSKKAQEILGILIHLHTKLGKTLIVVSHDPSMLRPGMRLLQMEDGQIIDDIQVTTEIIERLKERDELRIYEDRKKTQTN
ncbi:MAG: ABC transporter ATP-binding protein [Candidatus Hodarchaeales archaeon]|jgi:putative ABC transport system ATP-binding protein